MSEAGHGFASLCPLCTGSQWAKTSGKVFQACSRGGADRVFLIHVSDVIILETLQTEQDPFAGSKTLTHGGRLCFGS